MLRLDGRCHSTVPNNALREASLAIHSVQKMVLPDLCVQERSKAQAQERPSQKPRSLLQVHKELSKSFKYAVLWGSSGKFSGQRVGRSHELSDGDIIEIHI